MRSKLNLILVPILVSALSGCSYFRYRDSNDAAVELLRQRLASEQFDEIYNDSSPFVRSGKSREEIISKLNELTNELKKIDPEIDWAVTSSVTYDRSVMTEDRFSSRELIKNEYDSIVEISWSPDLKLCGIYVFSFPNESIGKGFRDCD